MTSYFARGEAAANLKKAGELADENYRFRTMAGRNMRMKEAQKAEEKRKRLKTLIEDND